MGLYGIDCESFASTMYLHRRMSPRLAERWDSLRSPFIIRSRNNIMFQHVPKYTLGKIRFCFFKSWSVLCHPKHFTSQGIISSILISEVFLPKDHAPQTLFTFLPRSLQIRFPWQKFARGFLKIICLILYSSRLLCRTWFYLFQEWKAWNLAQDAKI